MYAALLRGVNVGGKNRLLMKSLIEIFVEAGCSDAVTYIQSGNVIFNAPKSLVKKLPETISREIKSRYNISAPVIIRSSGELAQVVEGNPFIESGEPEKTLHVLFLANLPQADAIEKLDNKMAAPDRFHVSKREVYLHLPNGVGRSKLTNAYFDSKLATKSTGRNWATVLKLLELSSRV